MKRFKYCAVLLLAGFFFSCGGDDNELIEYNAGQITGGPFEFVVDGTDDFVTGITFVDESILLGANEAWVVTNAQNIIIALPDNLMQLSTINFDSQGVGNSSIFYIRYEDNIRFLDIGRSILEITGDFAISNGLSVTRSPNADMITGGPFNFIIDGEEDFLTNISFQNENTLSGANDNWIVTNSSGEIQIIELTIQELYMVNFEMLGVGESFVQYIRHQDDLQGLQLGQNTNNFSGTYDLSNSLSIKRM